MSRDQQRAMRALVTVILLACIDAASAQAPTTLSVLAPDRTSEVTGLALFSGGRLTGQIRNQTPHHWRNVSLVAPFFDKNNNQLPVRGIQMLDVIGLPPGAVRSLEGIGFDVNPKKVSRIWIAYGSGMMEPRFVLSLTKPVRSERLAFTNDVVKVAFTVTRERIIVTLKNRTDKPIQVDWNSASYVDPEGRAHRVMHEGVNFIDRNQQQTPTVIPPTALIEEVIVPTDSVEYEPRPGVGWRGEHHSSRLATAQLTSKARRSASFCRSWSTARPSTCSSRSQSTTSSLAAPISRAAHHRLGRQHQDAA
jgi:hypothetical protein